MSEYLLETKHLTMKYGEQYAVNDLNIHVPKGKIYGLLGRNGAGKTTTMKMVMRLIHPTAGEAFLFGESVSPGAKKLFSRIGTIIETPGFYGHLTAYENLAISAKLRGIHKPDAIKSVLTLMGLESEVKKKVSAYSLGMNQRLGIAAAIMHEPELLILDEPTNGLDPIGIREMRGLFRRLCDERHITIVISSHILSEVEQIVDCVGILHQGVLLQEIGMDELQRLSRDYTEMQFSPVAAALPVLEREFGITDYKVLDDGTVHLFNLSYPLSEINRSLVAHDIAVSAIYPHKGNLEDYFTKLTGGNGIA